MTDFNKLTSEFTNYNPLVFDLDNLEKIKILSTPLDVQFSNNICYPEYNLGFNYYIHQAKNKMEAVEQFANRKKIYLVTSLFEKNIDFKEETEDGVKFTSIDNGIKDLINKVNKDFPQLLNRAFLKFWEMIVFFNLIPTTENFVSSHLAEGPGSFIQATILFRDLQEKLKEIKTSSKDSFYGVTLHSDHEHLLMQQDFIKYFSKEKPERLHIMETKSIKEIKDMYGGGKKPDKLITNGDLTKLNTIKQFAGGKDAESFAKPSDLVTADGGFDWKRENLQEQEAYKLIFSEILTAIKLQKDGGNFVIKIFESFTKITIKMIELLRNCYNKVYICKPYTSRISNSEKYIVCKNFNKSNVSASSIKKLEDMLLAMNKNDQFNIIDMFTDIQLSKEKYAEYKRINNEFTIRQYIGINNIVGFINLDTYNGIEFNEYLNKQIKASHFWNNLFLNTTNYSKIAKYFKDYKFFDFKDIYTRKLENSVKKQNQDETPETYHIPPEEKPEVSEEKSEVSEEKPKVKASRSKGIKKVKEAVKPKKNKSKLYNQKGGNIDKNNIINSDSDINFASETSIKSNDEGNFGRLESDDDFIDLNKI